MPLYDESRQYDIRKMQQVLDDPRKSEGEKKKAARVIDAIRDQAKYKSVQKIRSELTAAYANGDQRKIEHLTKEAQRIDRDYTS